MDPAPEISQKINRNVSSNEAKSEGIDFRLIYLSAIALFFVSIVFSKGTPYMALATVSYFTMIFGLVLRKRTNIHYKLMTTAIALDLSLVLLLEIQRNAVKTALSFSLTPLQQAHIFSSSMATLLYIPVLVFGFMRLKNKNWKKLNLRSWHMGVGITAFIFRSAGFIFMFSLLTKSH